MCLLWESCEERMYSVGKLKYLSILQHVEKVLTIGLQAVN